tara:strand:+ start:680 stop:1375 length:696 start_codon:yes stop_codon:yes gene_type:complete
MAYNFNKNLRDTNEFFQGGSTMYNPNNIVNTPSQGVGSGNGVQSADNKQNNNIQDNNIYNQQNSMSILQGYFPDMSSDQLSKYQKFVTPIPDEFYQETLADNPLYAQIQRERLGFLEGSRRLQRQGLQESLFSSQREARGLSGQRGFVSGRNMFKEISQAASLRGDELNQNFQRGLYDVGQDIADRLSGARRFYSGLQSDQMNQVLKLAELSDWFSQDDDDDYEERDWNPE